MRKRQVKKIGNSFFIALSVYDVKDFDLVEGDEVDIEDLLVLNSKNNKKKK